MVELVSRVEKLGPDTGLGTQGGYRFSAVSYKTQMKKNQKNFKSHDIWTLQSDTVIIFIVPDEI